MQNFGIAICVIGRLLFIILFLGKIGDFVDFVYFCGTIFNWDKLMTYDVNLIEMRILLWKALNGYIFRIYIFLVILSMKRMPKRN